MMLLIENSKYFKNLLSKKYSHGDQTAMQRIIDIDLVAGDFLIF